MSRLAVVRGTQSGARVFEPLTVAETVLLVRALAAYERACDDLGAVREAAVTRALLHRLRPPGPNGAR